MTSNAKRRTATSTKLVGMEDNMNLQFEKAECTMKSGKSSQLKRVLIRGSQVKFLILPDFLKRRGIFRRQSLGRQYSEGRSVMAAPHTSINPDQIPSQFRRSGQFAHHQFQDLDPGVSYSQHDASSQGCSTMVHSGSDRFTECKTGGFDQNYPDFSTPVLSQPQEYPQYLGDSDRAARSLPQGYPPTYPSSEGSVESQPQCLPGSIGPTSLAQEYPQNYQGSEEPVESQPQCSPGSRGPTTSLPQEYPQTDPGSEGPEMSQPQSVLGSSRPTASLPQGHPQTYAGYEGPVMSQPQYLAGSSGSTTSQPQGYPHTYTGSVAPVVSQLQCLPGSSGPTTFLIQGYPQTYPGSEGPIMSQPWCLPGSGMPTSLPQVYSQTYPGLAMSQPQYLAGSSGPTTSLPQGYPVIYPGFNMFQTSQPQGYLQTYPGFNMFTIGHSQGYTQTSGSDKSQDGEPQIHSQIHTESHMLFGGQPQMNSQTPPGPEITYTPTTHTDP